MSRWKASGIHLLLSLAVAGTLLVFMLAVWYPWPLFKAAGGSRLIFLIAAVDATLGPLITLIIFRSGKPGLMFDLAVISLLQLAALAYGLHAVYLSRPVYMVFTVDRFELVKAADIDPADLAQVRHDAFRRLPWGRPRFIGVERPKDEDAWMRVTESALAGKDLQAFPQYYVEYSTLAGEAVKRSRAIDVLRARAPRAVDDMLASCRCAAESLRFLPLRASTQDAAVIIDATTGQPLRMLLIDPW